MTMLPTLPLRRIALAVLRAPVADVRAILRDVYSLDTERMLDAEVQAELIEALSEEPAADIEPHVAMLEAWGER